MGTLHRTEIVMYIQNRSSPVAQKVKNLPAMWETWIRSLGWEDPLEKGMATHSSILTWRLPRTEEPGKLQSMGSQSQTGLRDFHFTFPCIHHLIYSSQQIATDSHSYITGITKVLTSANVKTRGVNSCRVLTQCLTPLRCLVNTSHLFIHSTKT